MRLLPCYSKNVYICTKQGTMKLIWEQTKVGYVAKINGIAVAQASEAFFNTYYSITMLLPFDGAEHKFATLEDAQKFIVADVLHTINLLIR